MAKSPSKPGRKKAAPKDPNAPAETKEAKFSRLATARVTKAVKTISLIANLSGSGYSYSPEQVSKIETLLTETVTETIGKFSRKEKKAAEAITI